MQRRTASATLNGSTPWPAIHSRVKVALGPRVGRRKSRSSRRECRSSRSRSLGRIDLQHIGRGSIWHSEQKPLTDQCAVGRRILAIRSEKLENSKGSPPCSQSSGEPPTSFCAATQTNSTPQHAGRPLSLRDFGRFCQSVGVRLDRAGQAASLVNRSTARGGGLYWRWSHRLLAWGWGVHSCHPRPFLSRILDRKFPHQGATVPGELWADEDLAELDRRRCHAVPLLLDRAELKGSDADALPAVGSLANIACEFAISAEEQK